VRRRSDLSGWILMGFLLVGAMALIFYILLLRAQHLSSMEQQRQNPDPEARIEQSIAWANPVLLTSTPASAGELVPHTLSFAALDR
jgi:hypothetical protein